METEQRATVESGNLDRLLWEVGRGGRALVGQATRALAERFGDRGSCILIDDRARVVLSTDVVFLTGGAFTAEANIFLDEISNERMEKPFDATKVREMVQRFVR